MEKKKYPHLMLFCFMLIPFFGQNNKTIYQAYISGNMVKWKYAMDSIEAFPNKTNQDNLDLINYQYGYIAWCISHNKIYDAELYIEKAENLIEDLEKQKYNLSMLFAYKAAFVGFKIGVAPYKALFIGPQSLNYAKQSISNDSTNALGYIQLGNIAYYTPPIFGGSKKDAMRHYLKALKLMEQQLGRDELNWNYLNILATIVNAYLELEQYDTAKYFCIKTLKIEPNFVWVNNKLYPQVLKKTNGE